MKPQTHVVVKGSNFILFVCKAIDSLECWVEVYNRPDFVTNDLPITRDMLDDPVGVSDLITNTGAIYVWLMKTLFPEQIIHDFPALSDLEEPDQNLIEYFNFHIQKAMDALFLVQVNE